MENRFRDASALVERFLVDGAARHQGAAAAAKLHLAARTLADLRCGQYLIGNGFVIQMASVVRPAVEALNLIELFTRDPDAADRWAAGADYREFMPAKVRKTIGAGDDPVYSWLSEVSHPRFAGFQMASFRQEDKNEEAPVLRAYIGGVPLEFAHVLIASTFPGHVLCLLGLQLGHVEVKREVAWTWATLARKIPETLKPGFDGVVRLLIEHADDARLAVDMGNQLDAIIEHAREMETIVEEDRKRQEAL